MPPSEASVYPWPPFHQTREHSPGIPQGKSPEWRVQRGLSEVQAPQGMDPNHHSADIEYIVFARHHG